MLHTLPMLILDCINCAFCVSVLGSHVLSVRVGHRVWGVLVFLLYWELHRSCHLEEVHWEEGAKCRSISHVQQLRFMSIRGQNPWPVLSHMELDDKQCQDPAISRVRLFVDRGRLPSRQERVHEARKTLRTLRQWGKLAKR